MLLLHQSIELFHRSLRMIVGELKYEKLEGLHKRFADSHCRGGYLCQQLVYVRANILQETNSNFKNLEYVSIYSYPNYWYRSIAILAAIATLLKKQNPLGPSISAW